VREAQRLQTRARVFDAAVAAIGRSGLAGADVADELAEHPLADFVIAAIGEAQTAGRVARDADAGELTVIFLTGLFALLATGVVASPDRNALLDRYVATIVQGMEAR
jgi:hypothetical protein